MFVRLILLLLPCALLFGCGSSEPQRELREQRVEITWLGHQCFKLVSSLGITVVTNPFDPNFLPYPRPKDLSADVLLVTNENSATNHTDLLANVPQTFRSSTGIGSNRASGMLIRGVPTFQNRAQQLIVGLNTVFSWTMDGVRFCHLGNIRYALESEELLKLGEVDVLFLPVGGPPELTNEDRRKLIEGLRPKIVVPMGYRTRYTAQYAFGPLGSWPTGPYRVERLSSSTFSVSKATLPEGLTVMIPKVP